jgi:hypothetical protein
MTLDDLRLQMPELTLETILEMRKRRRSLPVKSKPKQLEKLVAKMSQEEAIEILALIRERTV